MNGAIMFCAIAAMVALLTAGLWFGLANWLRAGPKTRSLLSVLFGQMIFGAALLVDGAPSNGVIVALFRCTLRSRGSSGRRPTGDWRWRSSRSWTSANSAGASRC